VNLRTRLRLIPKFRVRGAILAHAYLWNGAVNNMRNFLTKTRNKQWYNLSAGNLWALGVSTELNKKSASKPSYDRTSFENSTPFRVDRFVHSHRRTAGPKLWRKKKSWDC
jgi:hypothetical protein